MKPYIVMVDGSSYPGVFADSCSAILDAMDKFPMARRISARPAV